MSVGEGIKRKPGKSEAGKGDLLALAEAVSIVYGQPAAEAATAELREALEYYQLFLQGKPQGEQLRCLLQLILVCPVLIKRPPGFEWVTDELHKALHKRKYDPELDCAFWRALKELRALSTNGRASNKVRYLFRYELVQGMMNPVTTAPGKGVVRVKGLSKSEAVEKLATLEQGWSGRNPETREIWRSLRWAEDYFSKIRTSLQSTKKK